ncbi:MAG: DMT family transporter [Pseudomonadota bacterium]
MKGYGFVMLGLTAGIAVPLMAALNAQLGTKLANPFAAAAVLCVVAFLTCLCAFYVAGGSITMLRWPPLSAAYGAGALFTVYIASITFLAPRIGVGNAVFLVLLGQLVSSAAIDHFGLFGAERYPLDWKRMAGLALMTAGILLARKQV